MSLLPCSTTQPTWLYLFFPPCIFNWKMIALLFLYYHSTTKPPRGFSFLFIFLLLLAQYLKFKHVSYFRRPLLHVNCSLLVWLPLLQLALPIWLPFDCAYPPNRLLRLSPTLSLSHTNSQSLPRIAPVRRATARFLWLL
ncbi:hypothetical protein I3843_12G051600 [Carya illinoinensis]|nr:hypothetical protein I3843_12G051600 [Carya illinoinensis]